MFGLSFSRMDDVDLGSEDLPRQVINSRFSFPKTQPTKKSVFVFPALDPFRQLMEAVHIATPQHDVISNEAFLQLRDREDDFAFPFFYTDAFDPGDSEKIFDDVAVAIWKIAELEREKHLFEHERRAETGPKAKNKHSSAMITSQGLHCGVVDHVGRFAQRFFEIETGPTLADVFRLLADLAAPNH